MSRDDSGGVSSSSSTVGSTLAAIVKKLFGWTTAADDCSTVSSSCSVQYSLSSDCSTNALVDHDLNGNVQRSRNTASSSTVEDEAADMKDTFRTSRLRRTGMTVCRQCGSADSGTKTSEFQTTMKIDDHEVVVCMRCCYKLAVIRRNAVGHRRSATEDYQRATVSGGSRRSSAVDEGEPVCCCDSCSNIAMRLRVGPESSSKCRIGSLSSADLLSSTSSLPLSSSGSVTSLLPRPRFATVHSTKDEHLLSESTKMAANSTRSATNRVGGGNCFHQRQSMSPLPDLAPVDLPPLIPVSRDGEENFAAYQRSLVIRNQAVFDSESSLNNGRAPPNVTIRHLTDDDGVSVSSSTS